MRVNKNEWFDFGKTGIRTNIIALSIQKQLMVNKKKQYAPMPTYMI